MKKLILSLSILCGSFFAGAQTATNFTVNDCSTNSHTLFTELDAGKIIVMAWVMPCSSCIGGAQAAYNAANSYSVSNPNKVFFYLADDVANTSCATLSNWATTNNVITGSTLFSNAAINMNDYGTAGMPKIVVLAGVGTHSVYYNQNSGFSVGNIQTAINQALADMATGIQETTLNYFGAKLSPNPAGNKFTLSYNSKYASNLSVEIYNMLGQKNMDVQVQSAPGENQSVINTSELKSGVYFLKLNDGKNSELVKFIISH